MSDLHIKASEYIDTIEHYYDIMCAKLQASDLLVQQARQEAEMAFIKAQEAQKSLRELQEAQLKIETTVIQSESVPLASVPLASVLLATVPLEQQEDEQKNQEVAINQSIKNVVDTIKDDVNNYIADNTELLELQKKNILLEEQNQELEEKYQKTFQALQKEMTKVDTMQIELELLQRERDIALRKQSLSPEQKKLLVKLEYENYKINEAIERIDYISDTLRKILGEDMNNKHEHQKII